MKYIRDKNTNMYLYEKILKLEVVMNFYMNNDNLVYPELIVVKNFQLFYIQ